MTSSAEERLETIRSLIKQERKIVVELRSKVSDDLGLLLKSALEQLNFVEGFFLDPSTLVEDRSEASWEKWLDAAERALSNGIELHSNLNRIISKYGTDSKIVG
jgi:hypothetical protein